MTRFRDLRVTVLASCIAGAAAAVMRVPLHKVGSHNAAGRLVAADTATGDALLLRRQSVSSSVDASKHAVELSNFMDAQVRRSSQARERAYVPTWRSLAARRRAALSAVSDARDSCGYHMRCCRDCSGELGLTRGRATPR
jgi:hypothetical protein